RNIQVVSPTLIDTRVGVYTELVTGYDEIFT
ncbi:unnamed protein product, partial [marine sediment metagenome]